MSETIASLPYHEPGVVDILIQASFLLLLNAVSYILDRLIYCGLIGQLVVGIAWGTPGAKWIPQEIENVVVQLGYLGLILLVYEGGLSTSFPSLKANIVLSIAVAITGISVPIAFSFALQGIARASPLQAFSAGAALCSTSLGTTFTILGTTGLTNTRLGVVLTSAAMLDDIVGLVMVQVISNLGASGSGFKSTTVVRPVFVSLAFAVLCPVVCRLITFPITLALNRYRERNSESWVQLLLAKQQMAFSIHTLLLAAMVIGSSYAGTSNLFAAYLTGAMVSWWDSEVPHPSVQPRCVGGDTSPAVDSKAAVKDRQEPGTADSEATKEITTANPKISQSTEETTGSAVFDVYYAQPTERILKPFFFASIGFSIPISKMFTGSVVWRGIIYTILMIFGKMICGVWLIRTNICITKAIQLPKLRRPLSFSSNHFWGQRAKDDIQTTGSSSLQKEEPVTSSDASQVDRNLSEESSDPIQGEAAPNPVSSMSSHVSPNPKKPLSLQPAAILGFAMVSRGEIGFLISSLADSNGIFSKQGATTKSSSSDDIFLAVTWAIVLCTIVGPVGVGLLVRRLRKLEKEKEKEGVGKDVLGVWGVR